MAISREDIENAAILARIHLDDDAKTGLEKDLSNILQLVDQLQSADTDNVTAMAHPLDAVQRLRPDEVTETVQRERYQQLAAKTQDGLYLVPRVVE
ncbi:MAG: Asp-tRNA(Asn)/Glu-tRNA(Gln) amidotransferase subunit GatC [Halomonadaceae bacterium]|nr:MAG: Asp-tRNA(Asn)/Glu-tRNA(Gln) amidotransferase subunit GatC [Halomonadaceae bacterium]